MGAARKLPALNATAVRPAFSGEKCWPACSHSANAKKKPCMPAKKESWMLSPAANAGMRNSPARSSDSAGRPDCWRLLRLASRTLSTARPARPAASSSQVQAGQPSWRPSSSG